MSDLEELAARGQARKDEQQAAARKAAKARSDRDREREIAGNAILQRTLAGQSRFGVVAIIGAFACVFSMIGAGMLLMPFSPVAAMVAGGVILAGYVFGTVVLGRVMGRRSQTRELHWLKSLSFAFDIDRYLKTLSKRRDKARVRVDLVFLEPIAEADRELLTTAALGIDGVKRAKFVDDHLRIESDAMETRVTVYQKDRPSKTYNTNAPVHAWFRTVADSGIRAIQDRHPLERVELSVY